MVSVILDTNIIIDIFRRRQNTIDLVDSIGDGRLALSVVTLMELYHGVRNKREVAEIQKLTSSMVVLDIDKAISSSATQLVYDYGLSHNLNLPDALIAATAVLTGFELFTYNEKDFRYIPDCTLYQWT